LCVAQRGRTYLPGVGREVRSALTQCLPTLGYSDPFAEAEVSKVTEKSSEDYVHIRVQQRNGRKSLTTIQVSAL